MNCKPGDLAIRVAAPWHARVPRDALVQVRSFVGAASLRSADGLVRHGVDVWDVEYRGDLYGIPDSELRPIRDQDGTDETLTWAPVPGQPVEA